MCGCENSRYEIATAGTAHLHQHHLLPMHTSIHTRPHTCMRTCTPRPYTCPNIFLYTCFPKNVCTDVVAHVYTHASINISRLTPIRLCICPRTALHTTAYTSTHTRPHARAHTKRTSLCTLLNARLHTRPTCMPVHMSHAHAYMHVYARVLHVRLCIYPHTCLAKCLCP